MLYWLNSSVNFEENSEKFLALWGREKRRKAFEMADLGVVHPSSSYRSSRRSASLCCNRVSDYYPSGGRQGTNGAFTYSRGSGGRGQLHLLHPATRQQRHLQAEQVGRQAAGRLGDAEAHPGEDNTGPSSCCGWHSWREGGRDHTYPCCLAILSR